MTEKEKELQLEINHLHLKLEYAHSAIRDLWAGTVWGAGKGAVLEFNKRTLQEAGVEVS